MKELKKWNIVYWTLEDFEKCFDVDMAAKHRYVKFDTEEFDTHVQQNTVYAPTLREAILKVISKLSGCLVIWIGTLSWKRAHFEKELDTKVALSPLPSYRAAYNVYVKMADTLSVHIQEFAFLDIKTILKYCKD